MASGRHRHCQWSLRLSVPGRPRGRLALGLGGSRLASESSPARPGFRGGPGSVTARRRFKGSTVTIAGTAGHNDAVTARSPGHRDRDGHGAASAPSLGVPAGPGPPPPGRAEQLEVTYA
jgi:hypothetical protein